MKITRHCSSTFPTPATGTTMGNFVNLNLVENQYFYQRENDRMVALVHDVSRSSLGSLSLRAFRLSPAFMAAFKEAKFTTDKSALPASSGAPELQRHLYQLTVPHPHLCTQPPKV